MSRSTIKIEKVKDMVNTIMRSNCTKEERMGVALLFERMLHECDQYKGFNYLLQDEVPIGELPGVRPEYLSRPNRYENGTDKAFENVDEYRRVYYWYL